jgi:mono/diheme cytochrome c family protein
MGNLFATGTSDNPVGATSRLTGFAILSLAMCLQACAPEASPPEISNPSPLTPASQLDDPAAYRGAAIASQVCAQCHDASADGGPGPVAAAPSLMSVANRSGTTPQSLSHWLTSSHPTMPNYIFNKEAVDDLVAYIMTLKHEPQQNPR